MEKASAILAKRGWNNDDRRRQVESNTQQLFNNYGPNANGMVLRLTSAELTTLRQDLTAAGLIKPIALAKAAQGVAPAAAQAPETKSKTLAADQAAAPQPAAPIAQQEAAQRVTLVFQQAADDATAAAAEEMRSKIHAK